jgi:RimJ/RimL family protein N-acetyltransferase
MITEESFVDFKCPYCGDAVSFPAEHAGSVQECPDCGQALIVPGPGIETGGRIPLPITTERLVLRRFEMRDWKALLEMFSDEELFRYTGARMLEEEEILRWLESDAHVRLTTPDQPFCLGIEGKEAGRLIGYASLQITDPQRAQMTLTIYLNRNFQRQGLGREALEAVLGFCFQGVKMHRVSAFCDSRNTAACKLFERAGLRREGEFLKDRFLRGEWANTVAFALLAEERPRQES